LFLQPHQSQSRGADDETGNGERPWHRVGGFHLVEVIRRCSSFGCSGFKREKARSPEQRPMRTKAPEIRANWTRIMLDNYERHLPADARQALAAAVPPSVRAELAESGPLEWRAADLHMQILAAPFPLLGADAYRSFWRRMMNESYDLPLFRSFVHGAVAIFKNLPGQMFRVVPQGFGLIARGCGVFEVTVDGDAREVRVVWADVPHLLVKDDAFVFAWAGTLESVLDLTGTEGVVTIESRRPSRIAYRVAL
jgi:hypothetical protein